MNVSSELCSSDTGSGMADFQSASKPPLFHRTSSWIIHDLSSTDSDRLGNSTDPVGLRNVELEFIGPTVDGNSSLELQDIADQVYDAVNISQQEMTDENLHCGSDILWADDRKSCDSSRSLLHFRASTHMPQLVANTAIKHSNSFEFSSKITERLQKLDNSGGSYMDTTISAPTALENSRKKCTRVSRRNLLKLSHFKRIATGNRYRIFSKVISRKYSALSLATSQKKMISKRYPNDIQNVVNNPRNGVTISGKSVRMQNRLGFSTATGLSECSSTIGCNRLWKKIHARQKSRDRCSRTSPPVNRLRDDLGRPGEGMKKMQGSTRLGDINDFVKVMNKEVPLQQRFGDMEGSS